MTMQLEFYKGKGFVAEIVRTNRIKTASVKVEAGKVSVVVPKSLTDERIQSVVEKKTSWIIEKLLIQQKTLPVKKKEYVSGESFSYLGRNYRLKQKTGSESSVKLVNGRLTITQPSTSKSEENTAALITGWYVEHARKKLAEKVERYSKIVGVTPRSIGIKTFKSRWGSCHANGNIDFNWRIIMAPNRIVDYVVVHELCHMKQHDHSPKFWKCVERILPDYQECKDWLKENGKGVNIGV